MDACLHTYADYDNSIVAFLTISLSNVLESSMSSADTKHSSPLYLAEKNFRADKDNLVLTPLDATPHRCECVFCIADECLVMPIEVSVQT